MGRLTNNSTKIEGSGGAESEISSSASFDSLNGDEHDERDRSDRDAIALSAMFKSNSDMRRPR